MLDELTCVIARSRPTLLQDAIGAASLVVLLWAGLHLPLLF